MRKLFIVILFLLSFTVAKSQILNYKYTSDTTCILPNIEIPARHCFTLESSVIFYRDSTVVFESQHFKEVFKMLSSLDTLIIPPSTYLHSYLGIINKDTIILAIRNDEGKLVSVGVANINNKKGQIFKINKILTNGNDDSYKSYQRTEIREGESYNKRYFGQINNR